MSKLETNKQNILNRIIDQENITEKEAEKVLQDNILNIKYIILLWDYFLWCKRNRLLNDFSLNEDDHSKALDLIKDKPYYDKTPYLSLSVHNVILMSDNISYNRYVEEQDVKKKYPLHKIFLLEKKEMDYIQSLLQ